MHNLFVKTNKSFLLYLIPVNSAPENVTRLQAERVSYRITYLVSVQRFNIMLKSIFLHLTTTFQRSEF